MLSIQWNMDEALAVREEEGYEDGRLSIIKNMIVERAPLSFISKVSGMSEDEIRAPLYIGA